MGGSLALTRALGDHALKGSGGGVSATPHYAHHRILPDDQFLLLASDGVWDVMTDDDACQLVLSSIADTTQELSKLLVQTAITKGTRDNVSALVVRLQA